MNLNIKFDLDNTLVDLYAHIKSYLASKEIKLIEHNDYSLVTDPQISNAKLWDFIRECYYELLLQIH